MIRSAELGNKFCVYRNPPTHNTPPYCTKRKRECGYNLRDVSLDKNTQPRILKDKDYTFPEDLRIEIIRHTYQRIRTLKAKRRRKKGRAKAAKQIS